MNTTTPAQMHVRLSRYLPRELAQTVSPNLIGQCCQEAWDNGWRDPEWLANYALEGTGMANVANPAALFTQRLKEAAAMDCPEISTPTPSLPDGYWRTDPVSPDRALEHIAEARRLLHANTQEAP